MTLSYKNKLYVQIGVLGVLIAASAWGSLFLFGLITQAGTTLRDAQNELALLSIRQEQIATIAKEYEGARELFSPLKERLLPREERLRFIMLVEQLALEAGVLHEIGAADDAPVDGTAQGSSSLHFNITISGSFPSVLRFIYLLENSRYFTAVEKAQVMQGGGTMTQKKAVVASSPNDVKAQLTVKVYTRPTN
ncbi:hypothetical protein HY839_00485 [Candidatus Azambacteria bacterium]|nr:hypothetical protein [Candidatus Azambacteria bacterium]